MNKILKLFHQVRSITKYMYVFRLYFPIIDWVNIGGERTFSMLHT